MENVKFGKIRKAKGNRDGRGSANKPSDLTIKIRKRLNKMKPGQEFEIIGVTDKDSAAILRSRISTASKKIGGKFSTSVFGDILIVTKEA